MRRRGIKRTRRRRRRREMEGAAPEAGLRKPVSQVRIVVSGSA